MYTSEEKAKIERIITAFQQHIAAACNEYGQPACEIVWLEQLQCYLYVNNYSSTDRITGVDLGVSPVESAKELYWEIMFDIVQKEYHQYNFQNMRREQITKEMLEQAEKEITIAVEPYLTVLPEYRETGIEIIEEFTKIYQE